MEKKLTLKQRIISAQWEIQFYQKELCLDLVYDNTYSIEYDIHKLKLWTNYIRNTCLMHGINFSKMLL